MRRSVFRSFHLRSNLPPQQLTPQLSAGRFSFPPKNHFTPLRGANRSLSPLSVRLSIQLKPQLPFNDIHTLGAETVYFLIWPIIYRINLIKCVFGLYNARQTCDAPRKLSILSAHDSREAIFVCHRYDACSPSRLMASVALCRGVRPGCFFFCLPTSLGPEMIRLVACEFVGSMAFRVIADSVISTNQFGIEHTIWCNTNRIQIN